MESQEQIFDRIKVVLNAKNDTDVAEALGIRQQSVTSARKRGQIPPGWIAKIAAERNVSADWLFFGTGNRNREDPLQKGGLRGLFEADNDFLKNKQLPKIDNSIWRMCIEFSRLFLDELYKTKSYSPKKIIQNKLAAFVADEIAFKLGGRIIGFLEMNKRLESIGDDLKDGWPTYLDE